MIKYLKMLGPGLLYAGAAIGVSHLVQSTRAGAVYGFELFWVIIVIHALKYPFFEFAPRYAVATGKSLIEGYRYIGKWAVWVFIMTQILTMFAVLAAISLVSAGILGSLFNWHIETYKLVVIILISTVLILSIGKFRALNSIMKIIILLLTVSTIAALLTSLGSTEAKGMVDFSWAVGADIAFIIAFAGWMPAPLDLSVWHSTWIVANAADKKRPLIMRESMIDFKVGFFGTAIIAFCFLSLGALVMGGSGQIPSANGAVFASQLIAMYTASLGSWAYPIIGAAALTTMLSTTITVVDGFPRGLSQSNKLLKKDADLTGGSDSKPSDNLLYYLWMAILVVGSLILVLFLSKSMHFMVDVATTIAFVITPILAWFNYRVVNSKQMPESARPSKALNFYALTSIILLSIFSIVFILWRLNVI